MANDIFQNTVSELGASFNTANTTLSFSTGGPKPAAVPGLAGGLGAQALVQNVDVNYQQRITRVYEISSRTTTFVGGRTEGEMSMARIVGPQTLMSAFYTAYGQVCGLPGSIAINVPVAACVSGTAPIAGAALTQRSITATGCILTGVGMSVEAENMIVRDSSKLMINGLQIVE